MLKDTNPKDAVGVKKWRQYCTVPITVVWELGVAMLEGARKYGRHNYRVAGVRASVYIDAAKGHIDSWWEGEDLDADSGLSHITKAMASLAVLRDAMINDMVTDDRPPKVKNFDAFKAGLQQVVEEIMDRHPDAKEPFTALGESLKLSGAPTITRAEVEARMLEERSRAALKAKAAMQGTRVDAIWVDEIAAQTTERVGLVEVQHTVYQPREGTRFNVAHSVDGVLIIHPDDPEFDRTHVYAGLTTKQFCRLVSLEAEPGTICGMNCASETGNLTISHPARFDELARRLMARIRSQEPSEVELDWGNAKGTRQSRLTEAQWLQAIPELKSAHVKPWHGVMRPAAFSTGSGD